MTKLFNQIDQGLYDHILFLLALYCPHFDECEHIAQKCKHPWEEYDRPPCCFECDDLEGCDQRCQLYGIRTCRECGCTDEYGCDGGCSWVEDDLCSACQGKEAEA